MNIPTSILRSQEVCTHTGLSRTTVYRLIRRGQFPRPIRLTARTTGWLQSEIEDWIAARVFESRELPPPTSPIP
jgi:prophage regulatory protein